MANADMACHKSIRIYMGRFSTRDVTSVHGFCFCKLFRMVSDLNGAYQYRVCSLPECFYWQTSPVLYFSNHRHRPVYPSTFLHTWEWEGQGAEEVHQFNGTSLWLS